jgi:tetratricopeptide (TPR) repeat protein
MFTLYNLLEADPKADKARLKEAFRKAAKASHPDVCPDDADAPWRFRQIVRAHEILSDDELRAAYDHVVAFERRMQQERGRFLDNMLAKIVSGALTAAVVAFIVFGGYALSAHLAEAPIAVAATQLLTTGHGTDIAPESAAADAAETSRGKVNRGLGPILAALHEVAVETPVPAASAATVETAKDMAKEMAKDVAIPDSAIRDAEAALEPVPDRARHDARFFYSRGLLAYRFGDFARAIVNYDAALRLDPTNERAWRDRAAVFALTSRYDRAAADLAQADRIRRAHPVIVRHRVSRAGSLAQDAMWRQSQRARTVERALDRVLEHPVDQLVLTSQSGTVPWPAAAGG